MSEKPGRWARAFRVPEIFFRRAINGFGDAVSAENTRWHRGS
jgi:hypothetical protein